MRVQESKFRIMRGLLCLLCACCCSFSAFAQGGKAVSGSVSDSKGEAVIGASIREKGTANGTITDVEGRFSLNVSPDAVLQVSYLGYGAQEIAVGSQTRLRITLVEDTRQIDEVIVVGYATQRKSSMTAAVTNVSTKELQNIPRPSVLSALQGRVAGLTVNETTGEPDKTASMLIRGIGTIDGSTGPLILIDGTPSGSLGHISPYDIESISVLKDAAAAAIYGARAANGVILVTTRQGAVGDAKPALQFNSYVGFQSVAQFPKTLSAYEYAMMIDEINVNDGNQKQYTARDMDMFRSGQTDMLHGNTDWYDLCVMDAAPVFSNYLSLSGNGKIGRYFISTEYVDQKGVIKDIDNYDRLNVRANITSDVTKDFQVQLLSSYTRNHRDVSGSLGGIFYGIHTASSTANYKYEDGHYGGMIFANDAYLWDAGNPRRGIDDFGPNDYYWNSMNIALNMIYKPIEGLELRGMGVYKNSFSDNQSYGRFSDQWDPINQYYAQTVPATLSETWSKEYKYDLQFTAAYEKTVRSHFFKLLGGYSQESLRSDQMSAFRRGFINDALFELNAGDASTQTNSGYADQWSFSSLFGRLNYSYLNKYLFEANMRYDGSSRFAPGKQWGLFPSVSLGWNINKENFLADYKFIDNLKLRLSWGQLGNAEKVGLYLWFAGISSGSYYNFNDNLVFGTRPGSFANTELTWETTSTYNIGLDGSLWNGSLTFEADLWQKRTADVLLSVPISTVIGAPSSNLTVNAGLVGSHGFDLSVGHNGHITSDLTYSARLALSAWNSWIIDLKNRATPFSTEFRPGEDLGNYYGYECLGIISDEATLNQYRKIQNVAPQTGLGDLMYKDQNGDGKLDYLDNVKIGNYYTKGSYGLNLGLGYKGFDFQAFFQGTFNVDKQVSGDARKPWDNFRSGDQNFLDRWTAENPNADALYPKQHKAYNFNESAQSSFWIRNASYLKLKNLQLGYNLPDALLSRIGIENFRVYVSGTNLFTVKSDRYLDGYDPETDMNPSVYPTLKVYSVGINVQF